MNKAFKIKRDGKFVTVAAYEVNKYGNLQLSVNKKLLIALLKEDGDWLRLSVFDIQPKLVEPEPDF